MEEEFGEIRGVNEGMTKREYTERRDRERESERDRDRGRESERERG